LAKITLITLDKKTIGSIITEYENINA